ncbi:hypothetical protein FKW77_008683 [Venturia effusa]|uniref:tRNA (adenine(58)-N(1))-methyltransferase catalytic subunit TRM61 n=1 Tax=Venturia effusa TaxID=50376 RepID=A0A517L9T6_9PEZI|nr:hypothetical protein FKW77_008683 [Venturia effusa]
MRHIHLSRSSRLLRPSSVCCNPRRWASQGKVFREGDLVIVKSAGRSEDDGWLIKLKEAQKIESNKGFVRHQEIIGLSNGTLIRSHVGAQFRVFEPSLAEYVTLSRRLVTPIYPNDANSIVNLLDLHPPEHKDPIYDNDPLQILEVGTGNGSLTLYIAKAIHAYNEEARREGADSETSLEVDRRKAILHTTDVVQKHSQHAETIVKGFRHGLYASNVDFHVGSMEDFFKNIVTKTSKTTEDPSSTSTLSNSPQETPPTPPSTPEAPSSPLTTTYSPLQPITPPFLSHIIIDTPSSYKQIELGTKYLLPGGKIIIFNPSVTQIGECTELIKRLNLPLDQETVLELGPNISGGRTWDVRAITPRLDVRWAEQARLEKAKRRLAENTDASQSEQDALSSVEAVEEEAAKKAVEDQKFVMVCRPKVGKMIVGGGFVGVWRKLSD